MSSAPTRVQVEIAGWEIECCAPPPGVGDLVSWSLTAFPPDRDPHGFDHPAATTAWWRVEHQDDGTVLLADGPVTAYWPEYSGAPPEAGVRELTVELAAVFHSPLPAELPTTTGRVHRVRVTSQEFVLRDESRRMWGPVPGSLRLREVHRAHPFDTDPIDDRCRRDDTGVLVDLRV